LDAYQEIANNRKCDQQAHKQRTETLDGQREERDPIEREDGLVRRQMLVQDNSAPRLKHLPQSKVNLEHARQDAGDSMLQNERTHATFFDQDTACGSERNSRTSKLLFSCWKRLEKTKNSGPHLESLCLEGKRWSGRKAHAQDHQVKGLIREVVILRALCTFVESLFHGQSHQGTQTHSRGLWLGKSERERERK
jgi:hypothetical protein